METSVLAVTAAAVVTALATGLGALPFALVRRPLRQWLGLANATAAGFMLAASLALSLEGGDAGVWQTGVGAALGAAFVLAARRSLADRKDLAIGSLRGVDALRAVTIVAVMTVHSFSEGVGVGVAYGGGEALGVFITLAIAVHNIPEGLAISLVLVPRGARVRTAAAWSVFSSVPQPLMAVPAFLFVEAFGGLLPYGLGFAGGAMVALVLSELVPDAREEAGWPTVAAWVAGSFGLMSAFQWLVLT